MLGLFIAFALAGIGFAAGYATRNAISRKRRVEYLRYEPYVSPSPRPQGRSPEQGTPAPRSAGARADARKAANDITRSFQEVHIKAHKPARPYLHLVETRADTAARPVAIEDALEELVRRLNREHRQT